jgi:hypothetical protein
MPEAKAFDPWWSHRWEIKGIAADRGFNSESMLESLEEKDLFYGICLKNPRDLAERVAGDEKFVKK